MKILGLVLAGGRSSRMGEDKAMLRPFHGRHCSLLESSFRLLRALVDVCLVSCARGRLYQGFPCIEDGAGLAGPCRGIVTGLEYAANQRMDSVLALACDMPQMNADILKNLIAAHLAAPEDTLATLYKSHQTGKIEMLAAIYSIKFLPALRAGMARGESSLYWLLPASRRQILTYDANLEAKFLNCNTRHDLTLIES